jgi:membrane dipeptidase
VATADGYEVPVPPALDRAYAQTTAIALAACLFRLEEHAQGQVTIVRTAAELAVCLRDGVFAAILHFEGAEAIDPDLHALEVFHRAGLRSLGLVWSRPNAFASGVPFRFPHSPDTGPGLTPAGRDLVRACNRLRIMIDLSHLNEQGFWDVARLSDAPLVATHSNAHALCPTTRNLTDRQLDAIKESGGMVGINFAVGFLREDGANDADTPLETLVRHVDYLVDRVGLDGVGFGSDFDGATIPRAIGDAAGLPRLLASLRDAGYDEAALRKLTHQNWLRVLQRTWGA